MVLAKGGMTQSIDFASRDVIRHASRRHPPVAPPFFLLSFLPLLTFYPSSFPPLCPDLQSKYPRLLTRSSLIHVGPSAKWQKTSKIFLEHFRCSEEEAFGRRKQPGPNHPKPFWKNLDPPSAPLSPCLTVNPQPTLRSAAVFPGFNEDAAVGNCVPQTPRIRNIKTVDHVSRCA